MIIKDFLVPLKEDTSGLWDATNETSFRIVWLTYIWNIVKGDGLILKKLEDMCNCLSRFSWHKMVYYSIWWHERKTNSSKGIGSKIVSDFEKGNKSGDVLKTLNYSTESYSTA